MPKSLLTAFVLASVSLTGLGGSAQSQPNPASCLKAPKNNVPCIYVAQAPQQKGK